MKSTNKNTTNAKNISNTASVGAELMIGDTVLRTAKSILKIASSPLYEKFVNVITCDVTDDLLYLESSTKYPDSIGNKSHKTRFFWGDVNDVHILRIFHILFHEKYNLSTIICDSRNRYCEAPYNGYYTRVLDHTNCVIGHVYQQKIEDAARNDRIDKHRQMVSIYFIGNKCNYYREKLLRMSLANLKQLIKTEQREMNKLFGKSCFLIRHDPRGNNDTTCYIHPKSMKDIVMDNTVKKKVLNEIYYFKNSKDFYMSKKIPYKLGILIYGEPGTGKSSFAQALAAMLNSCVLLASREDIVSRCYDDRDRDGIIKRIVLIEEIDEIINSDTNTTGGTNNSQFVQKIRKTDLLDYIDYAPDGTIIVATTNNYHKFLENHDVSQTESNRYDPAIIRPGRFDIKFEMKLFDRGDTLKMIHSFDLSEDEVLSQLHEEFPISPAKLQFICTQTIIQKSLKNQLPHCTE